MARPGAFLTGFLPDHPAFGFDMTISNLTKQGEEGLFIASMRQTFLERSWGDYLSFSPPRGWFGGKIASVFGVFVVFFIGYRFFIWKKRSDGGVYQRS
ncbi:hypothetical protein [Thermanaerovibrio acidaminovorans]|uniref:hypothetical protein n=1 Tax=Thermanaerovibrio acidaminovorans TaxID=81462 RepID=UPI0013E8B57A|nr:hypothetical protein [Thermanaerovibrio acidaminovorans]